MKNAKRLGLFFTNYHELPANYHLYLKRRLKARETHLPERDASSKRMR